jgi:hypothetical protein
MEHAGEQHFHRAGVVRHAGCIDGGVMAGESTAFGAKSCLARIEKCGILNWRESRLTAAERDAADAPTKCSGRVYGHLHFAAVGYLHCEGWQSSWHYTEYLNIESSQKKKSNSISTMNNSDPCPRIHSLTTMHPFCLSRSKFTNHYKFNGHKIVHLNCS